LSDREAAGGLSVGRPGERLVVRDFRPTKAVWAARGGSSSHRRIAFEGHKRLRNWTVTAQSSCFVSRLIRSCKMRRASLPS
jgi:hypothetical protein